ncbi:hypothetical protein OIU74_021452 [Salix koriyanagi]|uniref:Uncharacterized protein n=1 Tax=Salix koriyanagi TaxID=2511006 RepID=A0A9Q0WJK5_9ROSI|nr:hypothetical protein OIU74_021452 [Salix koriyanagi]
MADHGRSRFSYVQEWSSALEHREACLAVAFLAVFLAMVFIPWSNDLQPPLSFSGKMKFLLRPVTVLLLCKLALWLMPVLFEGHGREQNVWFGSLVEGCSVLAGVGLIMLIFVLGSLQSTMHDSYSRPYVLSESGNMQFYNYN